MTLVAEFGICAHLARGRLAKVAGDLYDEIAAFWHFIVLVATQWYFGFLYFFSLFTIDKACVQY